MQLSLVGLSRSRAHQTDIVAKRELIINSEPRGSFGDNAAFHIARYLHGLEKRGEVG